MKLLFIMVGGFLGSIFRFLISEKTNSLFGTWIVNVLGSLFLAFTLYFYMTEHLSKSFYMIFAIGFCGAFTTFSTFSFEVFELIHEKRFKTAFLYVGSLTFLSIGIATLILLPIL